MWNQIMSLTLNQALTKIKDEEVTILQLIYEFRCLTLEQIKAFFLQSGVEEKQVDEHVKTLRKYDCIKETYYTNNDFVFFLTNLGVGILRHRLSIPSSIYDENKKIIKRSYYRASELEIYPKNIRHQVHLNQFVVDFALRNKELNYRYFDEKYMGQSYMNIRPDGMLSILDTDFFLEMDMSTESKKQLNEKWNNYRNFLKSGEYGYRDKNIVVLFIVDGSKYLHKRINMIKYTLYENLLDVFDNEFEFYVGTKEELLCLMEEKLIPACRGVYPNIEKMISFFKKNNFHATKGHLLPLPSKFQPSLYVRKLTEDQHVVMENGRLQEFFLLDYTHSPVGIMSQISYLYHSETIMRERFHRKIPYILIGSDEKSIKNDLELLKGTLYEGLYFTTFERLENMPLHEALFQIDIQGSFYHFSDNGLHERIYHTN